MNLLIVRNNSNPGAIDAAVLIETFLASQGMECTSIDSYQLSDLPRKPFDMAVALGGDGTILRTAQYIRTSQTPILGLNFGNLGFLANSHEEGVVGVVAAALAGDVVREERANLRIDILCEGEDEQEFYTSVASDDAVSTHRFFALNEMAVTRGANGRIIDFDLFVAGNHLAKMRGDGLVVASATGSTAYALSAGGPLVSPGFMGLVAVPVAPHSLRSRAIVTAPSDIVEVSLSDTTATREATLFIDGTLPKLDAPIRRICVQKGSVPTVLLRYKSAEFYSHASEVFF